MALDIATKLDELFNQEKPALFQVKEYVASVAGQLGEAGIEGIKVYDSGLIIDLDLNTSIDFCHASLSGCTILFSAGGKMYGQEWKNRDKAITEFVVEWLAKTASPEVLQKVWPDRQPVEAKIFAPKGP